MTTMLEVIKREREKMNSIIDSKDIIFKDFLEFIKNTEIEEIVFVGSGSSYSSALSSMLIVEKLSGIKTYTMFPNLIINKTVYNKKALYVLVSQSGTSSLLNQVAIKLKEHDAKTIAISSEQSSPLVQNCTCFIDLKTGYEEYSYSTLGFTCSMLTEILLGLELGLKLNHLTIEQYNMYLNELKKTPTSNFENIDKTIKWFNDNKNDLIKYENFILFGGSTLYGIATEGALKIMEITTKYISVGYEMDDGMHGPNYCFDERTAVIALNDGKDNDNSIKLMNLMKNEYSSGYMIGKNPIDSKDLSLDFKTDLFTNLEIITFVQILAYLLATENNMEIYEKSDPRLKTTKGKGYFNMHFTK